MASYIPCCAEHITLLRALLEPVYRQSGSCEKKAIAAVHRMTVISRPEHSETFKDIQEQLLHAVKTAHRDPTQTLCLYTDASGAFCAGVVPHCNPAELKGDVNTKQHQPLGFLRSAFSEAQEHRSASEREGLPIVESIRKMDYLFACEASTITSTDHRNLLFVFHPIAIERTLE